MVIKGSQRQEAEAEAQVNVSRLIYSFYRILNVPEAVLCTKLKVVFAE